MKNGMIILGEEVYGEKQEDLGAAAAVTRSSCVRWRE